MEQELLNIAIKNLSTFPELEVKEVLSNILPNNIHDGELVLFLKGLSFNIPFTIKRKVTAAQLPFFQEYFSNKGLILFESASMSIKKQLRKLGINYIEISGNAYIYHNGIYIFIDTKKKIKLEDPDSNTAFSKTGLKVIYQLLSNKDSINYTYRELGKVSGVSIDTIGRVYKELVRDKYLVKTNNHKYKIIDDERLFQDWVTLFNKTLRPKLKKRSFRSTNNKKIQNLFSTNFKGKISGELAAELISNYNIAQKAIIYVKGSFVDLAIELNLRPDKDGEITMIEQFWNDDYDEFEQIASLPLVYADLISDPEPRNLLTAKLIYNKYA